MEIEDDYSKECNPSRKSHNMLFLHCPSFQSVNIHRKNKRNFRDGTTGIYILYINSTVILYHMANLKQHSFFFFCKYHYVASISLIP